MLTILVTGAGGYIGSHATKRLLQEGYRVIAFDNFSRGFREPLDILASCGDIVVYEGDVQSHHDLDAVFQKEHIDAVMHFAALCSVDESVRSPELYLETNTKGTEVLLNVMKQHSVRNIIFSSTCAVYGEAEYLPIDEQHRLLPTNPYGESKMLAEEAIVASGVLYVIFRYFNVTGADADGDIGESKRPSQLLVQNAVRGALGIEPFILTYQKVDTDDGSPVRDYVDVSDIVEAHMQALKYLEEGGIGVRLNLGNGKGWSVLEIVEAVKKETGSDFPVAAGGQPRQGEYANVYATIEKAKEVLGWFPQKTLQDSIRSLKHWYEKKPHGYKK